MTQPTFSIIVPVYNAEKYLKDCLDSIKNQTYDNFEVLLIDDGAVDSSGDICDSYSASDSRFKTFHLQNGGVSKARNYGLNQACGLYVTFIDSDDIIEPDSLETYLTAFKTDSQIDAVKSGYFNNVSGSGIEVVSTDHDHTLSDKSDLFRLLEHSRYYSFVWNLCIRKDVIRNVRFNETINWLEDHIFSYECYFNCHKFKIISKPLYHYFTRESEASSLSYIKNPWVIKKAMELEYEWKNRLNNGKHKDIETEIVTNYLHNIHRLVNILYMTGCSFAEKKQFSNLDLRIRRFLYKDEKLFYASRIPFFLRNFLVATIYRLRNSKHIKR